MKLTMLDAERFEVLSKSGRTYEITYQGSGDADPDYVEIWDCSCPAARYGRECKHISAFLAWIDSYEARNLRDGETVEI